MMLRLLSFSIIDRRQRTSPSGLTRRCSLLRSNIALLHNSGRVTDRSQSCLNAIEFALTQACPGWTYDSVPHI